MGAFRGTSEPSTWSRHAPRTFFGGGAYSSIVWHSPQPKPLFVAGSYSGSFRSFAISGLTTFIMKSVIFGALADHSLNFSGSPGSFGRSGFGIAKVPCIAVAPWHVPQFM